MTTETLAQQTFQGVIRYALHTHTHTQDYTRRVCIDGINRDAAAASSGSAAAAGYYLEPHETAIVSQQL